MNRYRADLHVHTVLSPCGDLEMSPVNIVSIAARKGIDILGITDHNSTKHVALIKKLAEKEGIFVIGGAEVTTREEIHCLALFENNDSLVKFQQFLDAHLADVKNKPDIFGHQVVVNAEDIILEEEEKLLISATSKSLDEVQQFVHQLDGLFIPAHIDRPSYSMFSQLGFIPPDLKADALEISKQVSEEEMRSKHPELHDFTLIGCSDAHYPEQIGSRTSIFEMQHRSLSEIRKALAGEEGRKVWMKEVGSK